LTPKGFKVMLSGSVSPTLRQQLEARNIALAEKLSPVLTR
jgi:heterodisulfide reductase subunit B